jgi:Sulfotransferase domain
MTENDFTVDVVSPQFPCGAAWLANALLELQVPLWNLWGFDTRDEWESVGPGRYRYREDKAPWKQTLGALQPGREFDFCDAVRPRFSHAFPWQLSPALRTVWIVRDPRDALHSEWLRHQKNNGLSREITLNEFVGLPFLGGPVSFGDMLWLHLKCWRHAQEMQPDRIFLLRFEDWKSDPVAALSAVVHWLGLPASKQALRTAASASDVGHLLAIESSMAQSDPTVRQFNRAGIAYEWQTKWHAGWHTGLGDQWRDVFSVLGYAPSPSAGGKTPQVDPHEFLSWRGLAQGGEFDSWVGLIHSWLGGSKTLAASTLDQRSVNSNIAVSMHPITTSRHCMLGEKT